jgi:outer membrane protein assembly factor BamB
MRGNTSGHLILAVLLIGRIAGAGEGDWPHFRGPHYNGNPVEKSFTASSVKRLWAASVHTGMASMSIVGDRLYTMGNKDDTDVVSCLSTSDGAVVWTHRYPCKLAPNLYEGGPSATPTVHDGKVYTISKFGDIFCLDAAKGTVIWRASAKEYTPTKRWWGFAGSPTVVGDVVCFNAGDRGLGLHRTTGAVVWSSKPGAIAYSTIIPLPEAMLERTAVAVLTNEMLHIVDPADGKPVAEFEKPWRKRANCSAVSPAVYDGTLYVTHSGEGMSRLSLEGKTFKQRWILSDAAMDWFTFNQRVFHKGHFYFLKRRKGLCAVDLANGAVAWQDDSYGFGNLLLVGDTMFILEDGGDLIWGPVAAGRFKEAHRATIQDGRCWAYPVIHGGRIYARNATGKLVCFAFE